MAHQNSVHEACLLETWRVEIWRVPHQDSAHSQKSQEYIVHLL